MLHSHLGICLLAAMLLVSVSSGCRRQPHERARPSVTEPAPDGARERPWDSAEMKDAAPAIEGGLPVPLAEYYRDPEEAGVTSTEYSVVKALIAATKWGPPGGRRRPIVTGLFLQGTSETVDTQLGDWSFLGGGEEGLPGLGEGVPVGYRGQIDRLYRDHHGTTLIAGEEFDIDTLILSTVNTFPAQLVDRDLTGLRTERAIGIGDPVDTLVGVLGAPTREDEIEGYRVLWYVSRPEHVVVTRNGKPSIEYDRGNVAAYALKDGRVVEIWLHEWTTEPRG